MEVAVLITLASLMVSLVIGLCFVGAFVYVKTGACFKMSIISFLKIFLNPLTWIDRRKRNMRVDKDRRKSNKRKV